MWTLLLSLVLQADPAEEARRLVERLAAESVEERDEAARRLKELGPAARPALEKAAQAPEGEARSRARQLLLRLKVLEELTPRLRKALYGQAELLAVDDHAWTSAFLGAVRSTDLEAADLAVLAPRAVRGARTPAEAAEMCNEAFRHSLRGTIPEWAAMLQTEVEPFRAQACRALVSLNARETIPALQELLTHERGVVREAAVVTLGKLGAREAAPKVADLLKDTDPWVRARAAQALQKIGNPELSPQLRLLLKDSSLNARRCALAALVALGAKEAAADIKPLLKDADSDVQAHAAWALGELGAPGALEDILPLLESPSPRARKEAARAVARLGGGKAAARLAPLVADGEESVGDAAAEALERLEAAQAVPGLIERSGDSRPHVRSRAALALAASGGPEAEAALRKLLNDENPRVRGVAAVALVRMGRKGEAPSLLRFAEEEDPLALNSLNALRDPAAWRRISRAEHRDDKWDGWRPIEEILRELTGFPLDTDDVGGLPVLAVTSWEDALSRRDLPLGCPNRVSARHAMDELLEWVEPHFYVLEPDKIRILPKAKALEFWKAWWAAEQKR